MRKDSPFVRKIRVKIRVAYEYPASLRYHREPTRRSRPPRTRDHGRACRGSYRRSQRSIVGGEIHEYTHLLEDARRQAVDRLVQNARLSRSGERGIALPIQPIKQPLLPI
jgi:hypothetical protein